MCTDDQGLSRRHSGPEAWSIVELIAAVFVDRHLLDGITT
jgi:hypothetical protein